MHLAVLTSFALTQPVFGVLQPEFFLAQDAARIDVVVLAVFLTVAPPLLLMLAELATALASKRLAWLLHLAFVGGLIAILISDAIRQHGAAPTAQAALALLAGAAGAALYARSGAARSFLTVLAPAPLAFLLLFLLTAPVSRYTLASEDVVRIAHPSARTPVVVLVLDEMPTVSLLDSRQKVDAVRYPNFARLARGATWFRNATTVRDDTNLAVPSLLTGTAGRNEAIAFAADHPRNLFTFLGGSYRLHVSEPWTALCPHSLCGKNAGEPFTRRMRRLIRNAALVSPQRWLPGKARSWLPGPRQSRVVDRAEQFEHFVTAIHPSGRPELHFLHVLLPHIPWFYLPSGKHYVAPAAGVGLIGDYLWRRDRWLVAEGYQRHLLQLAYTDRLLGSLLDRLRVTGLYDRALLVVVADHGASFQPGLPRRAATLANAQDILSVPLFVKRPGQHRGVTSDRYVKTVDVLPTIADVIGARLPWRTEGRSVFRGGGPRRPEIVRRFGQRVAVGPAQFVARRRAALRQKLALFGSGHEGPGLFGFGPHSQLIGTPAPSASIAPGVAGSFRLENSARRAYDPQSDLVPARLSGYVSGIGPYRDLAIALNTRIVATTRSYPGVGGTQFSAVVPETSLRQGRNRVGVFTIAGRSGHRPRLQRVQETG